MLSTRAGIRAPWPSGQPAMSMMFSSGLVGVSAPDQVRCRRDERGHLGGVGHVREGERDAVGGGHLDEQAVGAAREVVREAMVPRLASSSRVSMAAMPLGAQTMPPVLQGCQAVLERRPAWVLRPGILIPLVIAGTA